ncbi:MAG: ATP-binding cassette domain-containing protein, partial [Sneathiella sp.]|nr:ATP-binding cassette domain-containing protein [Sneathiella sp.]
MLDVHVSKKLESYALDISFKANKGITALFGPSGAGKTMLAKMLIGLEKPDFGHIRLNDNHLYKREDGKIRQINVPPQNRNIGFVFQDHRLFPHYSVLGNLKYGMKARSPSRPTPDMDEVIHFLGIETLLHRKPNTL